jgi:hypothetical protein
VDDKQPIERLADLERATADRELREQTAARQKDIVELSTKTFDKAQSYTNIVIIGGYAGAFTVWSNVKASLSATANVSIAAMLLFSLTVFVAWEIASMIVRATMFSNMQGLAQPKSPDAFVAALAEYKTKQDRFSLLTMKIWPLVLIATIVPAIAAIGLLGYNFFALLVGWPVRPA